MIDHIDDDGTLAPARTVGATIGEPTSCTDGTAGLELVGMLRDRRRSA